MSNQEPVIPFAVTRFRNQNRRFGIKLDDRRRHMYLVGKTGMGKSTLLENMVIADIRAGNGVAVVDPHGDLAERILDFVPNNRINDVIYFNPADTKYPVAFNILESVGENYKHLVAYGLVGVFKKIWADSWGPRMEYIMTNTILALLDYPGSTLLGLMRMLVDKQYRKKVVAQVTDPVVKTFWTDEFANYSEKFRTEAIAPIQNKVGQFLSSAIIRNIVGQSKSTIEMREIMDQNKILIMNLAKGRIGEENSALLGAMMITKLQIAAMSRVDIPEEERNDFFLYVDEFQNFATDSFAGILSEARKYRLCLIMAHQYLEQLGDVVKAAVFGNVGTMIVFRIGAIDATEIEPEFTPQFLAQDIVNLPKYAFCLRLMIDGIATDPFSAIGLPPATGRTDNAEKVIKVSRERYARPQAQVEDRIIRWSGVEINRSAVATGPATAEEETAEEEVAEETTTPDRPETKILSDAILPVQLVKEEDLLPRINVANFIPNLTPTTPIPIAQSSESAPTSVMPSALTPQHPKINFVQSQPQATVTPIKKSTQTEVPEEPKIKLMPGPVKKPQVQKNNPLPTPPVKSAASPTISLADLKQGNVPKVNFGKQQHNNSHKPQPQSQPQSQPQQPSQHKPTRPVNSSVSSSSNSSSKINLKDLL